jgi:hypothetical protein
MQNRRCGSSDGKEQPEIHVHAIAGVRAMVKAQCVPVLIKPPVRRVRLKRVRVRKTKYTLLKPDPMKFFSGIT